MKQINYTVCDTAGSFCAVKKTDSAVFGSSEQSFHTHNHDEIYIFLDGDASFTVEEITYPQLKPYDILLIKSGELHCAKQSNANKPYKRMVLSLTNTFYSRNGCHPFRNIFTEEKNGSGLLISAGKVMFSDIYNTLIRLEKYIEDSSAVMVNCAITELLYLLSGQSSCEVQYKNEITTQTIKYINEHLGNKISLDDMANHFFVSKCHLCRTFKLNTGITVNHYITRKRIALTENLFKSGKSITDACLEAGFGSYTNFYKSYVKEKGINPRKGLNITD